MTVPLPASCACACPIPQPTLEHLVVMGLGDERTRRQVARILLLMMSDAECQAGARMKRTQSRCKRMACQCRALWIACATSATLCLCVRCAAVAAAILCWSTWIRLYEDDPQVGALAASLAVAARSSLGQLPDTSWAKRSALVLGLLSRQAEGRREAARQLADALYFGGTPVPTSEPYSADPFKVGRNSEPGHASCLTCACCRGAPTTAACVSERQQHLTLTAAAQQRRPSALHCTTRLFGSAACAAPQVVLDGGARDDLVIPPASSRLARSFRGQDVDSLLAILANANLAPELRRSAAEQLTALTSEQRLLELLEDEVGPRAAEGAPGASGQERVCAARAALASVRRMARRRPVAGVVSCHGMHPSPCQFSTY